jgi:Zn-dependent M28 family amino/carboxypeptidase
MLARLTREGIPIRMRLTLKTRFNPEASAYNVIATLRGREHPERIVIMTAHLDTQIKTVGANDDASGISVLYRVAKRLSETGSSKTIRFCIFGGEEYGMYGSRHYENRLKETGELSNVEFVMCFDEVGRKKQTHRFRATDGWLRLKLEKALDELKAEERLGKGLIEDFPMRWVRRAFGSDHAAFVEDGVPAISIGGGGYDGYSHTGSSGDQDTPDGISPEIIAYKADVALRLLKYLGALEGR